MRWRLRGWLVDGLLVSVCIGRRGASCGRGRKGCWGDSGNVEEAVIG